MPTEAQWNELPKALAKRRLQLGIKRLVDVVVSALALLILSPILLLLALAIRLDSPGPAIFRQERVGRGGRNFRICKFRSMRIGADKGPQLTARGDDRITRMGRLVRKGKLDELPQLWNVLKGEMSLVGPRPEVPRYVAMYTQGQRNVLLMRPGLTDPASLAYRNENDLLDAGQDRERTYVEDIMPRKLALNYGYILHFSLWGDISLLFRTVFALLGLMDPAEAQEV